MTFIELAAAVGVACGAALGVFTLLEKITGVGQRWLARGVKAWVEPLAHDLEAVKVTVDEVKQSIVEVQHLQRYHLGENGGSPRLHDRVTLIEGALSSIQFEQSQVRHDLEDNPTTPFVDWNGPYDDEDDA